MYYIYQETLGAGSSNIIKLSKGTYKVGKLVANSNSRVFLAVLMEGTIETNEVIIKIYPSTAAGEKSFQNEMYVYDSIEKKRKKDEKYDDFITRIYENVVRRLDYAHDVEFEGLTFFYYYSDLVIDIVVIYL